MSLRGRLRQVRTDERGFAMVIAVALMALVTIVSIGLMTLAQGEDSHSRRDATADNSYQAAEAGTDAYLSDLTESNIFWSSYMAEGEATRTDINNVAHVNDCSTLDANGKPTCPNLSWTSGTKWTYPKTPAARAADKGWYTIANTGYQYLIQVTPPNTALAGLAQVITTIDVTGRPTGSTDVSKWKTIETQIRPSSLADFQAFSAGNLSYAVGATTEGPIFVGEDNSGNVGNLSHDGTAMANLYAEGTVSGSTTYQNNAKKYDSTTNPTALCKLNNCSKVQFTQFANTITTVAGAAAAGGINLGSTDSNNSALSGQSPAYHVDAWKLVFLSNGTVQVSSCKKYTTGGSTPKTLEVYQGYNTSYNSAGMNPPVCGDMQTLSVPTNGAIYSAVDVIVSGVVKGKVTVATSADAVFGGNITYATPGQDVLGVEATGTLYIATWGLDSLGNITIWAAMFSLNGPWEGDLNCSTSSNYSNCHASSTVCKQNPPTYPYGNPATCTMYSYGSVAIYGDGSTSSIHTSQLFQHRDYNYDNNLLFVQPPYWPTLGNAFTILTQRPI